MTDIPIVMYHSVGIVDQNWNWSSLTIPWEIFEEHIAFLSNSNLQTITLDEYYKYKKGIADIPKNSIILTFDDGYLDNWVFVFPILKKYNFRGTIFINPEFVDPAVACRPNLEDVWTGDITVEELPPLGFLSWEEMKAMQNDGTIDIQSHSMSHTWYPVSSKIIDFRHPNDNYHWMDWNEKCESKWDYLSLKSSAYNYGEPVYEHGKSLSCRKYIPDPKLSLYLIEFVQQKGEIFFKKSDWHSILIKETDHYRKHGVLNDYYETQEQKLSRYQWELCESKKLISEQLKKEVNFLCWPGGGYDSDAVEIASKCYLASTLSSHDSHLPGFDNNGHLRIKRIGVPDIVVKGNTIFPGGRYLFNYIKESQGSKYHRKKRQFQKLMYIVAYLAK